MSDSPALPHKISNPWGIVFIGSIVSSVLYGITVIQTFIYYRTWGKDTRGTKLMVFVLLVLDTLHQVVTTWMTYHFVISTFGDPVALNINHWTTGLEIFCNALVAFMVESFLVYRVWRLSGQNKILTVIGATFALAHLGTNLASPILGLHIPTVTGALEFIKPTATAGLAVGVAEDSIIAGILCYCLWRGRTGFAKTDDMLGRIIAMTIATGMLTSVVGLANLLSIAIAPQTLWVTAFNIQLSKLYVNSMLASLNARNAIRTVGQSTFMGSASTTIPSQGNFALQSVAELPRPGNKVHVNIDVDQQVDGEDSMRKWERAPV
ncbi:hypothetical protein C8R46DRAFT_1344486 [Mycena filopes]|nr:hypothetical protein C8R46DRAFT_1125352 [Mycena filopes]KAJ7183769.1 hypothetical protein C8R46DRAFT_1344486 [Mycena filopes]